MVAKTMYGLKNGRSILQYLFSNSSSTTRQEQARMAMDDKSRSGGSHCFNIIPLSCLSVVLILHRQRMSEFKIFFFIALDKEPLDQSDKSRKWYFSCSLTFYWLQFCGGSYFNHLCT